MNNSIEIIGIDHGWSQMKTSNYCFNTSIKEIMFFNMTIDILLLEMNDWKCLTVRWKMRTSICSL